MDEARQVSYYKADPGRIIELAASTQQPPLDYWIGHLVAKVSYSDFAVRVPAALFGAGSIVLLYLLAGRFCAWPLAFFTALTAALLPFNLYFSQEARPYAISIFFLLAVLLKLGSLLESRRNALLSSMFLGISGLGYLYSRTLSPLVTLVVLFAILGGNIFIVGFRGQKSDGEQLRRLLAAVVVLVGALLFYLPVLRIVLEKGQRYVSGNMGLSPLFKRLAHNFDLLPVWQSFAAQTEPITIPLLILLLLAPVLTLLSTGNRPGRLWYYIMMLLPCSALLNIIIFQAKSSMPFRPPYAIYILPLTLLLGAGAIQQLWNLQYRVQHFRHLIRTTVIIGCLLILAGAAYGAIGYKSLQRKTDWRSVGENLSVYVSNQILLFHNMSLYGNSPIIRYYKGKAPFTDISFFVSDPSQWINTATEPIFVFLQAGPYYLTGRSRYPIMQGLRQLIGEEGIDQIGRNRDLELLQFRNLIVLKLRRPSENLAKNILTILDSSLPFMNKKRELFDCYLLHAIVAKHFNRPDWQDSLSVARDLAPKHMKNFVREVERRYALQPVTSAVDKSTGGSDKRIDR
ncbi:glycosyltransferase family 39 protein [Thermodesulfobacteriota bacterium]